MNDSFNFQCHSQLTEDPESSTMFQFKGIESITKGTLAVGYGNNIHRKSDGGIAYLANEESTDTTLDEQKKLNHESSVDAKVDVSEDTSNEIDRQFVGELRLQPKVSPASEETDELTRCRKFDKLMYDPKVSQQKRREAALEWQRKRRDDILDKIRQLEGDSAYSDSEPEEAEDFVKFVRGNEPSKEEVLLEEEFDASEQMDTASTSCKKKHRNRKQFNLRKGQRRSPPCRVMLSEWLIQKPEDFEDNWLGVFCPVGKRCLVVASRGKTRVFSRTDHCMGVYQSLLPGGRKMNYRDSHNRSRGVTILDCIWSDETHIFYVLDLMCWNSHSCNNCDTEYRQFFLASKFSENPELMEHTSLNPFPFILLPKFPCDQMPEVIMSSLPIFPQKVDGLLLFHKQTFYVPETNPLCLWVYLTDIERRLNMTVSPELICRQNTRRKKSKETISKSKAMEMDGHDNDQ